MLSRATIRRWNARALADSVGGATAFANRLKKGNSQISQLIGSDPRRSIGNAVAAQIEQAFGKPVGWLDIPRPDAWENIENKKWRALMDHEFFALIEEVNDLDQELAGNVSAGDPVLRRVPIVGDTQQGVELRWLEQGKPQEYGDEYLNSPSADPDAYALKVVGTELSPRMREGEVISVSPNTAPGPGDEVVVKMKTGETAVMQLIYVRDQEAALSNVIDGTRIVRNFSEIDFLHLVNGIFRASAVKKINASVAEHDS